MKPQIRDIIKKAIIDKKELSKQEQDLLLLYFSMSDVDADTTFVINSAAPNYVIEDLTSQVTGSNSYFQLSRVARQKVDASCNLQQLPSSIIMYDNMKGFNFTFIPTVRDHVVVGYFV